MLVHLLQVLRIQCKHLSLHQCYLISPKMYLFYYVKFECKIDHLMVYERHQLRSLHMGEFMQCLILFGAIFWAEDKLLLFSVR